MLIDGLSSGDGRSEWPAPRDKGDGSDVRGGVDVECGQSGPGGSTNDHHGSTDDQGEGDQRRPHHREHHPTTLRPLPGLHSQPQDGPHTGDGRHSERPAVGHPHGGPRVHEGGLVGGSEGDEGSGETGLRGGASGRY